MENAPEPTDAKPPGNASWRKHWDSLSTLCVAAGCVAVLAVTGETRLAGFVGIMLVVPVVLIAFPRFLGQGLPSWVDRSTPAMEVYGLGWLLLAGIVASIGVYVYYHARP